jgi:peptidoglycan/LPS O-acetylase OafA/YrhL
MAAVGSLVHVHQVDVDGMLAQTRCCAASRLGHPRLRVVPGSRFARVLVHLSKRSYGLYLIHGVFLSLVAAHGHLPPWQTHFAANATGMVLLTLIGSYLSAVVIDFVLVTPIERLISMPATRDGCLSLH